MAVTESFLNTYADSDALGLAALVKKGEVSPAETVEAAVTLIERLNPKLNAVIHKLYDMGRKDAEATDRDAPFAGVPFLLKELASSWKGAPLTNSSAYLKDVIADSDSEPTRRIKAAGMLLVGKSNAPENGWSISTEPKLYGVTKNPWKEGITAGGSSGGTASAVASRMVPIAEASDGAGSIRVPASCCGIVGLKPSRGRISLAPAGDFWYGGAYFFACTRTVRDTAAYLDAMAGYLPGEPYTPPAPEKSWLELAQRAPKKLRVGFTVKPPNGTAIDPEVSVTPVDEPQPHPRAGEAGFAVDRCELLDDGSVLIEFTASPGSDYEVQYSDDATDWKISPVGIRAAGNRVQWIDHGPPRTDSPPSGRKSRFYRVREIDRP